MRTEAACVREAGPSMAQGLPSSSARLHCTLGLTLRARVLSPDKKQTPCTASERSMDGAEKNMRVMLNRVGQYRYQAAGLRACGLRARWAAPRHANIIWVATAAAELASRQSAAHAMPSLIDKLEFLGKGAVF